MSSDYLKPKTGGTGNLGKRTMQNGMFKNPPTYMSLGGFTSSVKLTDPAGKRDSLSVMGLERSGPTAQKGKPI